MSRKDRHTPTTYESSLHTEERRAAIDTAVALHYSGRGAPTVTARGDGELAQRIIEIAERHGVPLHEDAALVQLLAQIEIGEEIPAALYIAVAEVIAFAYLMSGKSPEKFRTTE